MTDRPNRIPTRLDHDQALQLCWSGTLSEDDRTICNIIASSRAAMEPVEAEQYEAFQAILRKHG